MSARIPKTTVCLWYEIDVAAIKAAVHADA
jgi:hypothetical protein